MKLDLKELIAKLTNTLNTVTTISLGINGAGATGGGTVTVCGKVATITAQITPTLTGTTLFLAGITNYPQYFPARTQWLSCNYYNGGSTSTAEAYIGADGKIIISTPVANKDLKISGSWVIN